MSRVSVSITVTWRVQHLQHCFLTGSVALDVQFFHPFLHVCDLVCSIPRTPTAQISFVPSKFCRSVIARIETLAPLHESENVLPPPAKANVSMHGTPHVGFLLHMHPSSRWRPCAANAAFGTSAEVVLNLHDIETSPVAATSAWLEMFVHRRIRNVQGVCSFACTTIFATVSRISFVPKKKRSVSQYVYQLVKRDFNSIRSCW